MEGVARKVQSSRKRGGPARLNKLQIAILGRAVDFVSRHGMPGVGRVNPDLVGAAGEGLRLDKSERPESVFKFFEHTKFRHCRGPPRMNHSLKMNLCIQNLAPPDDWGVDRESLQLRMTGDDRQINLPNFSLLHRDRGLSGCARGFGDKNNPARFPVESVDQ